jgi:hypothetical protein
MIAIPEFGKFAVMPSAASFVAHVLAGFLWAFWLTVAAGIDLANSGVSIVEIDSCFLNSGIWL